MDFGIGSGSVYRIGAVRFISPTRAWVLDGRLTGHIVREQQWSDPADSTFAFPFDSDNIYQDASMSLLVGRRAYRAMGPRAMRTLSLGVGGGLGYTEGLAHGARLGHSLSWNGAVEGALGAHYRLTPSLALGGNLRLGATYWRADQRSSTSSAGGRTQRFDVGLGSSDLVLSLFF
jgi:hypothetical protein